MSLSTRTASGEAGFTLLEVLVALALVAGSLVAIGAVVAANARATRAIDQRLALVETARVVLAGLPGQDELVPGSITGEIDGHRWRVDIQPLPMPAADPRRPARWEPQAVVVRVEAPSGQIVRLDTVRLRPGQAGRR